MRGFSFNKALGGGLAATLLSLLSFVEPFTANVPLLAAAVGLGTMVLTWFTPKNVETPNS